MRHQLHAVRVAFFRAGFARTASIGAACLLASAWPASGETTNWASAYMNRAGVGLRLGFNIAAKFENLAGPTTLNAGPGAGGGLDRFYDDGFVRVDSSGNAGNQTWFWGYNHPSQVAGTDTLSMHAVGSAAGDVVKRIDDPQLGFEMSYGRVIGEWGRAQWGFEGGFGFQNIALQDRPTMITDTFALNGVVAPGAGYRGTFTGPGTLIGDTPTRTVTVAHDSRRSLDADFYGFRLGPFLGVPLGKRFYLQFGGGLAVACVDSEFSYRDYYAAGGAPVVDRRGRNSNADALIGGYIGAQLDYALTQRTHVFLENQFQSLGSFQQTAGDRRVKLDLSAPIFLTFGLKLQF